MKTRDKNIDAMRAIGLLCVILAHINPPNLLLQIRCFDVPLMLFVSGLVFSGRHADMTLGGGKTLLHRIGRLIIPTWLFLCFLFPVCLIPAYLGIIPYFCHDEIIATFLLRDQPLSIGYVWVIRIFIIVGIFTPIWLWITNRITMWWGHLIMFITLVVVQQLLVTTLETYTVYWFVNDWILYIFGYSSLFALGLSAKQLAPKDNIVIALFMLLIFIASMFAYGEGFIINAYKYPPQHLFIFWGAFVSMLLWITRNFWSKVFSCKFTIWLGQNTIWIYLWHIPFLKPSIMLLSNHHWTIRYILVSTLAICVFGVQYAFVQYIKRNSGKDLSIIKYLVG